MSNCLEAPGLIPYLVGLYDCSFPSKSKLQAPQALDFSRLKITLR